MPIDLRNLVELAEGDADFDGIPVHCWEGGTGRDVLLLHGSGAGAATLSNFRRILGPLAQEFHVLAADLVGFGQSGLKTKQPYFDMNLWVRQAQWLLDRGAGNGAIVIGHSLSGAIALKAAACDQRIAGVITTGTMGVPPASRLRQGGPRWRYPATRTEVQQAVERTFYNKSFAEPEEIERRLVVLNRRGYREYFEAMFAGPREDHVQASALTSDELRRIRCPVVLMHGVDDASFSPEESSLALANDIALADVYLLSQCGHSVAHERPREVLATVRTLADRIAEFENQKGLGPPGQGGSESAEDRAGIR